jgi:hypothetical protein
MKVREDFSIKNTRSMTKTTSHTATLWTCLLITISFPSYAEPPGGLLERDRETYSEQREKTRINRATAHYARSRSLILAAIDEFDKARRLADPSLLLNGDQWRASLVDKAKQMERVIAPRAREADAGVALPGDSRLLGSDNKIKTTTDAAKKGY